MPRDFILVGAVLLAATLTGCGKSHEDAPAINRALGDSPAGAPNHVGGVDMGILQDQTAYIPAKYEPLNIVAGAATGSGGGDAGPGADEARAVAADLLNGIYDLDVELILGCFEADQIKALNQDDYRSTMFETKDTLLGFWNVFKERTKETDLAPLVPVFEIQYKAKEPLVAALTVKLFDAENANVSIDMEKYQAGAQVINAEMQAALGGAMAAIAPVVAAATGAASGQAPAAEEKPAEGGAEGTAEGAPAAAAGGAFSPQALQQMMAAAQQGGGPVNFAGMPVKKTADGWKVVLPAPVSEELAEIINEGLLLVKNTLSDLTARMDSAPTLDGQTFGPMIVQVAVGKAPLFLAWQAKAMAILGPMMQGKSAEGPG